MVKFSVTNFQPNFTKKWTEHSPWDIVGHLHGSKGLSLQTLRKKSEKGFPGPLGPRGQKRLEKKSSMTIFQVLFGFLACFRLVFDFFSGMLTPGQRGPGNPFSDFFRSFPERRLLTSVDGRRYPNICHQKSTTLITPKISKFHHLELVGLLYCKKD